MRLLSLLLSSVFLVTVSGLCFGGGGGGGGCGCGCGRKKRSIDDSPPPFTNLAGKGEQMLCNSPELKEILMENMRNGPTESGKAIAANLDAAGERFVVVCAEGHFDYFIHPSMEFCGVRNTTHHCQAFVL